MGYPGKPACYGNVREKCSTSNPWVREFMAEFIGTFILIVLGDGSVAQYLLSGQSHGTFLSVNLAWGLAVAMGVWVSGGVTGGHINPAVTLCMCIQGRTPWSRLPLYWFAQYLGAFTGAACVFGVYWDALNEFDGGIRYVEGPKATAGIFAVYPAGEWMRTVTGFGDQVLGTAILLICILAITDKRNMRPPTGMIPFCVGCIVMVIGMTFGFNCGYAINPARDWGPRIFTCCAGWGVEPFSFRDYNWFWVPFVGPHIGAILGAWTYLLLVGNHFPRDEEEENEELAGKQAPVRELMQMQPASDFKAPYDGYTPNNQAADNQAYTDQPYLGSHLQGAMYHEQSAPPRERLPAGKQYINDNRF